MYRVTKSASLLPACGAKSRTVPLLVLLEAFHTKPLLQTRTTVLNDELDDHFERWYPGLKIGKKAERSEPTMKMAA